jgi:aspartate kinase
MEKIVVMKFGGKSLETIDLIKAVTDFLKKSLEHYDRIIAVVSAMGKTTDSILTNAKILHPGEETPTVKREIDAAAQTGEILSASYVALALQQLGVKTKSLNAQQLGLRTSGGYTEAKIIDFEFKKIKQELKENQILVVAGFQGIHEKSPDETVVLGRGGSDATAIALATRFKCKCIFFKKGAGGIQAFDPSIDPSAKIIWFMTYDEAINMTEYGYEFLMKRSLLIAKKFGVPLEFRSTPGFDGDPFTQGTIIDWGSGTMIEGREGIFTAIATKKGLARIVVQNIPNIPGWGFKFYNQLNGVPFIDSSQFGAGDSAVMSVIIPEEKIEKAMAGLANLKNFEGGRNVSISYLTNLSIITFIDSRMGPETDFFQKIAEIFSRQAINMEYQSSSGNVIHTAVNTSDLKSAVLALAEKYELLEAA